MVVTNHTGEKEEEEERGEKEEERRRKREEERVRENKINKSHNYKLLNTNSIFNPFNFNPFITHFTLLHL